MDGPFSDVKQMKWLTYLQKTHTSVTEQKIKFFVSLLSFIIGVLLRKKTDEWNRLQLILIQSGHDW